jgi:hypothetical protein
VHWDSVCGEYSVPPADLARRIVSLIVFVDLFDIECLMAAPVLLLTLRILRKDLIQESSFEATCKNVCWQVMGGDSDSGVAF